MSEFSVDAKGLFEVVGMFEEICRDCDQTGQILSESVRRIYNIVGNSSPYEQPLKKLEQEIEKLARCQRNLRSAQRVLGDISNRYDALSQTFEPDFKSLLFGNLESFGAVGGGFTDILDLIINAVDNYEEFGTIHSKRFWEETLLETALDVVGGTLVSAIVGGLLAAAGISVAGIAIAAVTVGVMWAADVVCGYVQEAKGKESKRVTEAISDWALDTAKQ